MRRKCGFAWIVLSVVIALIATIAAAAPRSLVCICARDGGASRWQGTNNWSSGRLELTDPWISGDYQPSTGALIAVAHPLYKASARSWPVPAGHVSSMSYATTGFTNPTASVSEIRCALQLPDRTGRGNRLISINSQGRETASPTSC